MGLTQRDISAIDFINTYRVATTMTLTDYIYNNYNVGTRRLKRLVDEGYLLRERISSGEWVYYTQRNKCIMNDLMITNCIVGLLKKGVEVERIVYDKKVEKLLIDAVVGCSYNNNKFVLLIESELIKTFNKVKYDKLFKGDLYKDYFPIKPIVVVIDNKPIEYSDYYTVIRLNRDMSNFEKLENEIEKTYGGMTD